MLSRNNFVADIRSGNACMFHVVRTGPTTIQLVTVAASGSAQVLRVKVPW
jgi:hypothetical protein